MRFNIFSQFVAIIESYPNERETGFHFSGYPLGQFKHKTSILKYCKNCVNDNEWMNTQIKYLICYVNLSTICDNYQVSLKCLICILNWIMCGLEVIVRSTSLTCRSYGFCNIMVAVVQLIFWQYTLVLGILLLFLYKN